MPWGKWKGVQISLLPNDYISFLTTTSILDDPRWNWLKQSLLAELRHRGLREPEPRMPIMHIIQKQTLPLLPEDFDSGGFEEAKLRAEQAVKIDDDDDIPF